MKRFKIAGLIVLALILVALPLVASAGKDKADDNVYISADETIDGNLFKAGNSIIIDGTVNGDVFVAGNSIVINGPIRGSLFVAGNSVTINGEVGGSIFAVGSNLDINGQVGGSVRAVGSSINVSSKIGKNFMGAGSNLILKDSSSIGWDALIAGANLSANGTIGRNAELYGEVVTIGGKIGGNVKTEVGRDGTVIALPTTRIFGNLDYKASEKDQLTISDGAVISGETIFSVIESRKGAKDINLKAIFFFITIAKLISLFGLIIVGLVILAISKKVIEDSTTTMLEKPWPSLGWGLVLFFITPFALILLALTLIGIPLAAILLPIYFISLYLAKVMAAFVIGNRVITWTSKTKKPNQIWSLIIGAVILIIVISIPIFGWVIKLLVLFWGLGALMLVKKELLKKINK